MKNLFKPIISAAIGLLAVACTDTDLSDMYADKPTSSAENRSHHINPDEATYIANEVLSRSGKPSGRSSSLPVMSVVTSKPDSRSGSEPDTLAYIMNYPDNGGFAIISADNRVYPVLGFSHSGSFSLDNEIATTQFIDRIETYVTSADPANSYTLAASDFRTKVNVDTLIKIQIDQDAPYNKYVVQNEGDYLVGCVAVASAYVMAYSRDSIRYNDEIFHTKSILRGLGIKVGTIRKGRTVTFTGLNEPRYTYDKAMDEMSRMLYWIGKNVGMSYGASGRQSSASSYNAYFFIRDDLKYNVSPYKNFNANEISQYITDNYIIYMRGSNTNKKGGHAWVSDGCYYLQSTSTGEKKDIYLHCNWGWGGKCNGYFTGNVFEANWADTYANMEYFAVKIEK